jgi:glycosyltransferase involved in cell wall biosynthesis
MSSVSFVIPVFNKEKYLVHVLDSLCNQKGSFKREFIFIDDGSTDNSLMLLKNKTKGWKNCQIITQKNKGSAGATNVGIRLARNKYIKFLDADDLILYNTTNTLLKIIEGDNSINLVYGLQRKVKDFSNINLNLKIDPTNLIKIKDPIRAAMTNSMFNPSQFIVKTNLCKKVGGCDERIKHSQEYSLTLRLSMYEGFFKLNEYLAILPEIVPGQISEKKVNQIYRVSRALELYLNDNKELKQKYRIFAQRRLTGRSWRFARRFVSKIFFPKFFFLYLKGLLGISNNIEQTCSDANSVYKEFLD